MQKNFKIAVIIAAYNAEKTIKKCIKSVQNQKYWNWKIYLIDDGSTDNTKKIVAQMSKNDNRIVYEYIENNGKRKAHIRAINKVEGCDLITFLDSDDYFTTANLFESCVEKFKDNEVDLIGFNYERDGRKGFKNNKEIILNTENEKIKNLLIKKYIDGNICYNMYRYKIVKEKYSDNQYNHEDYKNKYAIMLEAKKIIILPLVGYSYQRTSDSFTQRKIREEDYFYYLNSVKFTKRIINNYAELNKECEYFRGSILLWSAEKLSQAKDCIEMKMYNPIMYEFKQYKCVFFHNKYFSFKQKFIYCSIYFHFYYIIYFFHKKLVMKKNFRKS